MYGCLKTRLNCEHHLGICDIQQSDLQTSLLTEKKDRLGKLFGINLQRIQIYLTDVLD